MPTKVLSIVCVSLILGLISSANPVQNHVIPNPKWESLQSCGDAGREEREYKFTIQGTGLNQFDTNRLATEIRQTLEKNISAAKWQAPKLVSASYTLDRETADPVFVDIYYDMPTSLNYDHDVSYRFRMRFGNVGRVQNFVKKSEQGEDQPRRMEYQAKVDRKWVPGSGFSTVIESRCEGGTRSGFVIPSPLTNLQPFLISAQTGVLETNGKSCVLWPARIIVEFFERKGMQNPILAFVPVLTLETERRRDHFNINAKLGTEGRQTFIITVDTARIYGANTYLSWLHGEVTDKPTPLSATINEVEVEFDRSTAQELDRQIQRAVGDQKDRLMKLRDAFLADQSILMETLKERFEEISKEKGDPRFLYLVPGERSKYRQAKGLLSR